MAGIVDSQALLKGVVYLLTYLLTYLPTYLLTLQEKMAGIVDSQALLKGVVSIKGYEEFLRAYEETVAPFSGW